MIDLRLGSHVLDNWVLTLVKYCHNPKGIVKIINSFLCGHFLDRVYVFVLLVRLYLLVQSKYSLTPQKWLQKVSKLILLGFRVL